MKTVTINTLYKLKQQGDKFPVITAYDAAFSRLIEQVGIEVVLVGDSLGNVIQGQDSTLPVTMEHMTYHVSAVRRGNSKSLIVADLPFMAYATEQQAWLARTVAMLTERGIPVCGHLGLTPQSVNKLGGYRVQGRDEATAEQMINDARALEKAGIDLLVLECVPATLAKAITEALATPVIGIGAGADTDAQVLVLYDMLGLSPHQPSFAKNFLAETGDVTAALSAYAEAVRTGLFPQSGQSF